MGSILNTPLPDAAPEGTAAPRSGPTPRPPDDLPVLTETVAPEDLATWFSDADESLPRMPARAAGSYDDLQRLVGATVDAEMARLEARLSVAIRAFGQGLKVSLYAWLEEGMRRAEAPNGATASAPETLEPSELHEPPESPGRRDGGLTTPD